MTEPDLAQRLAVAEKVTRDAGALALRRFEARHELAIERKGAQDFVTAADRDTETAIVEALGRAFPGDGVLGEEHGQQGSGDWVWIVDPIDGTANFVRGIAFWCVSLGLWHRGDAVLGVIHDPVRGETFSGGRGLGARCDGKPIRAAAGDDPHQARFALGFNHGQPIAQHLAVIRRLHEGGAESSRLGSAALGLAYTAAGRLDGFWEGRINSWDVCAGIAIARAAGAAVDDFFAGQGPSRSAEVLVASPGLRDFLHRATRG